MISVMLATYNERGVIGDMIRALLDALGSLPCEIIVIDDDSPDRTWEVVR